MGQSNCKGLLILKPEDEFINDKLAMSKESNGETRGIGAFPFFSIPFKQNSEGFEHY